MNNGWRGASFLLMILPSIYFLVYWRDVQAMSNRRKLNSELLSMAIILNRVGASAAYILTAATKSPDAGKDSHMYQYGLGCFSLCAAVAMHAVYRRNLTRMRRYGMPHADTIALYSCCYAFFSVLGLEFVYRGSHAVVTPVSGAEKADLVTGLMLLVPTLVVATFRKTLFGFVAKVFEKKQSISDGSFIAEMLDSSAMVFVGQEWWVKRDSPDLSHASHQHLHHWHRGVVKNVSSPSKTAVKGKRGTMISVEVTKQTKDTLFRRLSMSIIPAQTSPSPAALALTLTLDRIDPVSPNARTCRPSANANARRKRSSNISACGKGDTTFMHQLAKIGSTMASAESASGQRTASSQMGRLWPKSKSKVQPQQSLTPGSMSASTKKTIVEIELHALNTSADALLAEAEQKLRCVDWSSMSKDMFHDDNPNPTAETFARSRPVKKGEQIDIFLSHSVCIISKLYL